MSRLKVRKIAFRFGDDIPFQFNPHNRPWSNFVNYVTVIAPGFERYFIRAIRAALPQVRDPRVRDDAELFCQQEAQHSRQHLAHLQALSVHYPGLDETRQAVLDSYETLFAAQPLAFHLAYAATVELAFGPLASFLIRYRDPLFRGGDARISSFLLWHFVEEFEHRNAAIDVFRDVVGSHAYRLRAMAGVVRHLAGVARITADGLRRHGPQGAGDMARTWGLFRGIPATAKLGLGYDLLCTVLPYHVPDNIVQPDWATQWLADEAAGHDMSLYYAS